MFLTPFRKLSSKVGKLFKFITIDRTDIKIDSCKITLDFKSKKI